MSWEPIEKILAFVLNDVEDGIRTAHYSFSHGGHETVSPIEAILETAIFALTYYGVRGSGAAEWLPKDRNYDTLDRSKVYKGREYQVGNYRADFVFAAYDKLAGKWQWLAVECDGHDYHERTKQQAAHDRKRDRWFQQNGWTVFRFTGSEIVKDPIDCAITVIRWAWTVQDRGAK